MVKKIEMNLKYDIMNVILAHYLNIFTWKYVIQTLFLYIYMERP